MKLKPANSARSSAATANNCNACGFVPSRFSKQNRGGARRIRLRDWMDSVPPKGHRSPHRGVGAAVESFRNEVRRQHDELTQIPTAVSRAPRFVPASREPAQIEAVKMTVQKLGSDTSTRRARSRSSRSAA